jgi:exodeoxyribonuclease V alpha subunit
MSPNSLSDLQGQIERITYVNEENSYTVAKVKVYGRRDLVTVIGNIVNPTPGEVIKMKGEWGNHPKFGEQFKIVFCQTTTPATVYGIEKYLGSGLVKGIGPVMAKRIVKRFKEETLNIIEQEIEKLVEVAGIGKKRTNISRLGDGQLI